MADEFATLFLSVLVVCLASKVPLLCLFSYRRKIFPIGELSNVFPNDRSTLSRSDSHAFAANRLAGVTIFCDVVQIVFTTVLCINEMHHLALTILFLLTGRLVVLLFSFEIQKNVLEHARAGASVSLH